MHYRHVLFHNGMLELYTLKHDTSLINRPQRFTESRDNPHDGHAL